METLSFTDLALIILFLWLAIVSFLLFRTKSSWRRIAAGAKNLNLVQILEQILRRQEEGAKSIHKLSSEISQLSTLNKLSFQKSAMIRFNPFEDTGGDQSFIVAILNGQNSGLVISSLHSRNGTRIYAKQIQSGKPSGHDLSKEEREVVERAIKS